MRARHGAGAGLVGLGLLGLLVGCDQREDDLLLLGTVERTLVELVAPVSEEIVSIEVVRGQRVARGQLLLGLDKTFALAEVARAEALVASARTAQFVALHDLQRAQELRRTEVTSEQQLDRARLGHDEASARLREAEALAVAAHKRLRDLELVAPVDGVVDQIPFDAGERVPAGSVLVVILSDAPPWVRVWVPETSYVRVLPGTPAEIEIDGVDEPLRGSVLDVARESEFTPHFALTERDRVHLVYETRVQIVDAPASLRPGIPARVRILAPERVLRSGS